MGRTVIEKIISAHTEEDVIPGRIVWMDLDVRSARDFAGANVVQNFEREYPREKVRDPGKTFFTFDCNVPANTIPYANNQHICRIFARNQGIEVYDVDMGIGSHVMIEQGLVLPGSTIVGTDSHLNLLGSVGAFGQGMGDQDIAFAFKTGRTWFEVPETIKVNLTGSFSPPTSAKDLVLRVLKELGSKGGLGKAIEFYGSSIEALSLGGRITLASMATEMGAISAFVTPSDEVLRYCRERSGSSDVEPILADADAEYCETIEIDVNHLKPQIAAPPRPDNVVTVDEIGDVSIDSAFFGSCTNGRLEDFEVAANLLRGKRVAERVMAKLVPATKQVYGELLSSGLLWVFYDAGVIVSNPGCGGCASGQIGMTGKGEIQISTSNRNFPGKQGEGATYLASPATVAASALYGEITNPERCWARK